MNSLNHYAYGSIVEWMYRDMCGLNPTSDTDTAAGFRHAKIAPKPDKSLQSAKARYRSAAGTYESGWCIDEQGRLIIEIVIPFNASADIFLPDAQGSEILINDQPLDSSAALTLSAGRYKFEYLTSMKVYEQEKSTIH